MREIKLQKVRNIREFGGLVNKEGKRIKNKCCIRSASLGKMTKKDLVVLLNEYQVRQIIDLRTEAEIKEMGKGCLDDYVTRYNYSIFTEETVCIDRDKGMNPRYMLKNLPDMGELYRFAVKNPYSRDMLSKSLHTICNHEQGAILWHCTEGKDRCGMVSALFLSILDVDREQIYQDYLLTNVTSEGKATRFHALILFLTRQQDKADKIRGIFRAEKRYIQDFFSQIEEDYGDVETFLEREMGITPELRAKAKKFYLEN